MPVSPAPVTVRAATAADLGALVRLQDVVHAPHVAREPHRYAPTAAPAVAAWLAAALDRPNTTALLAVGPEGRAWGYALCMVVDQPATPFTHPRRSLRVDQLAVAQEARRRGVGRALMAAAEALGRDRGCAALELDVRADNDEARAFYAGIGYAPRQLRLGRRLDGAG